MDTPDETMRKISAHDQLVSGIKQAAEMAGEMFTRLREQDMTRQEAFAMTQTWLNALLMAGGGKR